MIKETDINGVRIRVGDLFVLHDGDIRCLDFGIGALGIVVSDGCFFALMEEETTIGGIRTIDGECRYGYLFTEATCKIEIIDHHSLSYWGLVDKSKDNN